MARSTAIFFGSGAIIAGGLLRTSSIVHLVGACGIASAITRIITRNTGLFKALRIVFVVRARGVATEAARPTIAGGVVKTRHAGREGAALKRFLWSWVTTKNNIILVNTTTTVAIVDSAKVYPNPIITVLPAVAIASVFISEVAAEALLVAIAPTP